MHPKILILITMLCSTTLLTGCFRPIEPQQQPIPTPEQPEQPAEPEQPILPVSTIGTGAELVDVTQPAANSVVSSPLVVSGEAPGYWFFEATAPIVLANWDGLIIGESYIEAQGEWMTTGLVTFSGVINFTGGTTQVYPAATLILQKQNASGLPENDASVEIPLLFY